MTYTYSAPDRLEDDWRRGERTPPQAMLDELRDDIDNIESMVADSEPLIPVQGRISDYKSWLAAAVAMELSDSGMEVTVFAPQRTNRESSVEKLRRFGAELLEHPGRIDLCIWEPWRDNVGHVDKSTCESIGCPYYLDSDADIAERTADAVSKHRMWNDGGVALDAEEMKDLGGEQDYCPAQLYLHARGIGQTDGAVNVATYAKAFADAAIADDNPLDGDALLLDEAHTLAADPDVVAHTVDPGELTGAIETVTEHLSGSGELWAQRAHRELTDLRESARRWLERSEDEQVQPNEVFAGESLGLADAFDTLDTVDGRLMQGIRRRIQRQDWDEVSDAARPYKAVERVRGFLSRVKQYRDGGVDFVHSLYQENGELVNEMAFRSVDETVSIDQGTTPGAVYREWEESGTHPAIRRRWGALLDRYIESLWDGRSLHTTNDLPGAPMTPMNRLREIAGADSVVTLSATHNEMSDPTRPPEQTRPTRHDVLAAPICLRAEGSERTDYDGSDTASPDTPWFMDLVNAAKERSGNNLAAVPINYANASKWEAMPVETLTNDDGEEVPGVVPNSRGAVGEKGLEQLDIDTVLCGVQVQGPAPTARRLVQWWEMMAPRHSDPADVLDKSWRLLAQHAVSGTIQAGGRFDWHATNLVFERPELFELAGFECREATRDDPGFAGEFVAMVEDASGEWVDRRDAVRAARVVGYLDGAERKTPSVRQVVGEYRRTYDAGEEQARRAIWLAHDRGKIEAVDTDRGARFRTK